MRHFLAAVPLLLVGACSDTAPRTAADSQAAHVAEVAAAGGTVDSIFPIAEQLRRFRDGLPSVDTLRNAATSRDALIRQFLRAVSASDTLTLNQLVLDRSEFAYLYYPHAAISQPPYEAPPQLLWGQILMSTNDGLPRVLARAAGQSLDLSRVTCADSIATEGPNRLHEKCALTLRIGKGSAIETRWFGTIVERDGRFKFLGYANPL
ncbi:hypothetical protein [Gemmatimonas phototrophica]|uniref:Uncharacterized protein n=1 Tax=Gemmatimonas phototrophica TaxID=1379270 RepID=A0A143BLI5_9BACT|nr:hypothetical protein [Gemmatimonas phototrophica]AMW05314.1 hypothetical protein GEMMAAP_11900 [Gemmatimonas phototrophica]